LQDGLPLVAKPYSLAAARLGWSRSDVTSALANMIADGVISRFGCVLRHRELGYAANAMAVWDVDDGAAGGLGRSLAAQPGISLCYLRKRAPPQWPFNLYAMVHGICESQVRSAIARASAACGLDRYPRDILFSRRCFLQRGARFGQARDRRAA
jgi:DNA-binding Lrp family transcriptional regulator